MATYPSAQATFRNSDSATFAVFCAALLGISVNAAGQAGRPKDAKNSSVREKISASVVSAKWQGATPAGDAETTAVCVTKEGWFACLVPASAGDNQHLTLTIDGIERVGEILVRDPESGLCLAKVETETAIAPLPLSQEGKLQPGSRILQLGEGPAFLAGRDREYLGETLPISLLRIHHSGDTPGIGEPVFCQNGDVAGILTDRKLQDAHEAHAVPAARISKLINDYDEKQLTGNIWIGASFHRQSTTPQILVVKPDSPAKRAGLKPGDIILKVNGRGVSSLPALAGVCENLSVGKPVKLEVLRKLETINCELIPELQSPLEEKKSENSSNKTD